MAEVDTSSYPKPQQSNFLDVAGKYQGLAQGALNLQRSNIALSQDKLKQINDQFGLINNELATLANDPNATKEQAQTRLLNISKTFGFKPEVTQHMLGELQAAPDVQSFAKNALVRGMQIQEKVNNLYGSPQILSNNQQSQPVAVSPMNGVRPIGKPYQLQPGPDTGVVDTNPTLPDGSPNPNYNRPTLLGPRSPIAPPGVATLPGGAPQPSLPVAPAGPPPKVQTLPVGPNNDPRIPGPSANFGGNVTGVDVGSPTPAQTVENRFAMPGSIATGQKPGFDEGLKQYNADQARAGSLMQAAKPAIQALPLMQSPGFLSGPLTDQFTKIVAGLKSSGLIDIKPDADPTAIRQEVVKKLNQYVSSSPVGQRSDAAQTLKEASSPSPNVQILPALIKLTKDAVALDRVQAAMPNAFKGKDYENYTKHQGTFPQSVDERAFTLDLEPQDASAKLVDTMGKQLQSKNVRERNEAQKFFKSLRVAKDQGFYQ